MVVNIIIVVHRLVSMDHIFIRMIFITFKALLNVCITGRGACGLVRLMTNILRWSMNMDRTAGMALTDRLR